MKIPYERYAKVLIAARKSNDAILQDLRDLNFKIDPITIDRIRESMYLEQPDYFDDYNEPVDVEWLEHHNIDKMFGYLYEVQVRRSIDGAEGAIKVLEDAHIYRIVTSMILGGFDIVDIELVVQGKLDVSYTLEDFQEFQNYFFDLTGWTKRDKEVYLVTVSDTELKRSYKEALKGDKNKLLWKLKLSPALEFDEMLREISYDSFYKFKDLVNHNPDLALKFAAMLEKLANRMEKLIEERKSDSDVQKTLNFIFEEEDKNNIKTFAELKKEEEGR